MICASQGPESLLKKAVQGDWKGNLSPAIYVVAILVATDRAVAGRRLYAAVAAIWLVPDRRIERMLTQSGE